MFNKFTLRFKDRKLEDQYQEYQDQQNRLPIFKHIAIFILVADTFIMIMNFINGALINQLLSIELFATTNLIILIVKKKPKFVRCALIIFNHLLMITSFDYDNICSHHYYYLRGLTMMAAQMIIAMSGEFLDSVFSILSIFTIRLLLLFLQDQIFPYSTVIIAVLLPVYLIYQIYKTNEGFRSQFQLACLDNQWDKILTTLIDGSYLLIEFDPDKMVFNCKKSNKFQYTCNSSENLKDFLRNNYIEKKNVNLDKFFATILRSQEHSSVMRQIVNVQIQKKIVNLQYSVFSGHTPMILIQVIKCNCEEIIPEEKYLKLENTYQSQYQKLLILSVVGMKKYLRISRIFAPQFKQIFYRYLQESLKFEKRTKSRYFNLESVFNILSFFYRNRTIKQIIIPDQIQGNKYIVCLILMDIFESQAGQIFRINTKLIQDGFEIQVESSFNQKQLNCLKKKIKPNLQYFKDVKYDESYIRLVFPNAVRILDSKTWN